MMDNDDSNHQEIDRSAGTLVWVQRRNGSWWPGRVLGLDELPESCLNLPRSGTPIKLLGREDGSVDWYNLEKSKRVKAFRCGEYDECIEKAKYQLLHPKRKYPNAGKYVRREEAILHALELEQASSFDGKNFCSGNNSLMGTTDRNSGPPSNVIRDIKEPVYEAKKLSKHEKSNRKLPQSGGIPNKQTKMNKQNSENMRWRTPNDSEDDTTEGIKRMRDLRDLGSGKSLKRGSNGHLPDNSSPIESDFDNDLSSGSPINSSRDSCSSLKRKRSTVVQGSENSRKKYRRRSLAKVWMDASKVKLSPVCHHGTVSEESSLQAVTDIKVTTDNSTLIKKESPSVIDASTDYSGTSSEDALLNGHANTCSAATDGNQFHPGMKENLYPTIAESVNEGLSDALINIRVRGDDTADLSPTVKGITSAKVNYCAEENHLSHPIHAGLISHLNEGLGEACSTGSSTQTKNLRHNIDTGPAEWNTKGKRSVRFLSVNKDVDTHSIIDRTEQKETLNSVSDGSLTSDSSCQLTTRDQKPNSPVKNDEKQEFASENSRGENVNPCILVPDAIQIATLPSKDELDSIVPTEAPLRPRQIRLPSRYRDTETSSSDLYDVELNVQSSYNGQRVPLVSLMSKFNGKAIVGHPITVEILSSKSHQKMELAAVKEKRSIALSIKSPRSMKKSSGGKKLGSSPRKIRRLSSFTLDRKDKENGRKSLVEKIGGPTVSCIPLRLVFSRLNEALSSSARTT